MYSQRKNITTTETYDRSNIALRYGLSPIYRKDLTLDGTKFTFRCESVNAIDMFLMGGSSEGINRSEKKMIDDFASYADGLLVRDDLTALDMLLGEMISSGKSCNEIQGGDNGTVYCTY